MQMCKYANMHVLCIMCSENTLFYLIIISFLPPEALDFIADQFQYLPLMKNVIRNFYLPIFNQTCRKCGHLGTSAQAVLNFDQNSFGRQFLGEYTFKFNLILRKNKVNCTKSSNHYEIWFVFRNMLVQKVCFLHRQLCSVQIKLWLENGLNILCWQLPSKAVFLKKTNDKQKCYCFAEGLNSKVSL